MPHREFVIRGDVPPALVAGLTRLAGALELPGDFPADVKNEAASVAANGPIDGRLRDTSTLPFLTIDPAGSMDLDQAMFIEQLDDGYRVWYAIVDVAAWVAPGGAIDAEARKRGETYYAPQTRLPLHPTVISEGAASLLADGVARPANVWRIDLDSTGAVTGFTVLRQNVSSIAKLDYDGVQRFLDDAPVDGIPEAAGQTLRLLKTVGLLRIQQETARGGISLNLPEQEVLADGHGQWGLGLRTLLPVENWNAQISLLTGYCAASLMRAHKVGILRTLPPADDRTISQLHNIAHTLQLPWPHGMSYAEFVRSLDSAQPVGQAMMNTCTRLFRGAGYTVIGGPDDTGDMPHAALASEYAHTTAPMRRLVDRFTGTICACLAAGEPIPDWVTQALADLPQTMAESDRRAKAFERGVIGLTEALTLHDRIGQQFTGVVIEVSERDRCEGVVTLPGHAIEAPLRSDRRLELGSQVQARLVKADLETGDVSFQQV